MRWRERISNGKKKNEDNSTNGNKYLACVFIEAAAVALRCSTPARRFYERKTAKRMPVVPMKALASKLARAAYYMMRIGEHFHRQASCCSSPTSLTNAYR